MRKALMIAAYVVLAGCPKNVPRPDPVPPTDTDDCPAACDRLRDLKCEEGARLPPSAEYPAGATCEQFCKESQDSGHSLRPSCVKRITKCSDMVAVQRETKCPF